jgi:hypothetical protein
LIIPRIFFLGEEDTNKIETMPINCLRANESGRIL